MITVERRQDEYAVDYIGKAGYDDFTRALGSLPDKSFQEPDWVLPKRSLDLLTKAFGLPDLSSIGDDMKLKPYGYQQEMVLSCLSTNGGCLIRSGCGTGKTAVGLALFDTLRKTGSIHGKGLIVAKAAIKLQWPNEINRFTGYSSHILDTFAGLTSYYAAKEKQLKKKQDQMLAENPLGLTDEIAALDKEIKSVRKKGKERFRQQFGADLLVCNYETLNDDKVMKELKKLDLEFVYADEIHVIKSPSAKRSRSLYKLNGIKYCFGATATPIQKNPIDIYSIFKFLRPDLFPSLTDFKMLYVAYNSYGFPVGAKNQNQLFRRIQPYMVVKTPGANDLPELTVIPRYCELTDKQQGMTQLLMDEIADLKSRQETLAASYGSPEQAQQSSAMQELNAQILARQTFAQELADTEELLAGSDSTLARKYQTGSKSSKIELLLDIVEEILDSGEKVCIFSRFRSVQPILCRDLTARIPKVQIACVNGTMSDEEKYRQWHDTFEHGAASVLVMSDAGAEGINLSGCQYLVEFEPATSYLLQTQRQGRIVRADSTHRHVFCYQLIANGSFDEIALKIVQKKQGFMDTIVDGKPVEP